MKTMIFSKVIEGIPQISLSKNPSTSIISPNKKKKRRR